MKHRLCLQWETRTSLLLGEGSLAFELQQIIQGLFQLLDMNLRLIQYLPLRTQTLLRRQPFGAAGTIFLYWVQETPSRSEATPPHCKVPPLALSVQGEEVCPAAQRASRCVCILERGCSLEYHSLWRQTVFRKHLPWLRRLLAGGIQVRRLSRVSLRLAQRPTGLLPKL